MKHLQQLKKENSDVQDQKPSHIKEESAEDSEKVLEYVKKKKFKRETHNGLQQKVGIIKEEEDNVKSGTGGECKEEPLVDDIEAVKTKAKIKNSSAKAKCKPVGKLKNEACPSVGELSPFRRKKLKI